ncbi:MAG: DUF1622 domain-containing protein [Saprospiraceae bacterium]
MQEFRFLFLQRLANGIELLSAVVLLIGFAKAMWGLLWYEIREIRRSETTTEELSVLRPMVTQYLLLGLDFYLIAAIISTMLHLEWPELVRVLTLGLLRLLFGYFRSKSAGEL